MGCISDNNILPVEIDAGKQVKDPRYAYTVVTDSILNSILNSNKETSKKTLSDLLNTETGPIPFKSVADKVRALNIYSESNQPFGPIIGILENSNDARYIATALATLISAQKAQTDAINKYNLTELQADSVRDSNGNAQESYYNMANVIGRAILKGYGKEYAIDPKSKTAAQDFEQLTRMYIKVGEEALGKLEAKGLLNIKADGSIINRRFMKDDSKGTKFEATDRGNWRATISGIKTISLNPYLPENVDEDVIADVTGRINAVVRLTQPVNSDIPTDEARTELRAEAQDINVVPSTEEVLLRIQNNPMTIDSDMIDVLQDLYDRVNKDNKSTTKSTLAKLANFIENEKNSKFLFGTLDFKDLKNTLTDDVTGIEKTIGRSEAKVLQFVRIFDDWDMIKNKDLHYSVQIAIQNRAHIVEQTLNYQQDNFLSRHILGTSEVQVLADEDTRYMIAYIADETGFEFDEILGNTRNDALERAYATYTGLDNKLNAMFGLNQLMTDDFSKAPKFYGKMKSAWQVAHYIRGIRDIREGLAKGEVTTRFMPEPDGTASGAYITILQASGRNKDAAAVVGRMQDATLNDAYDLTLEYIDKDRKVYNTSRPINPDIVDPASKANFAYVAGMDEIVADKIVPTFRDLVKLPFTTFIYGQQDKTNIVSTSKDLVDLLLNKESKKLTAKYLNKAVTALNLATIPTTPGDIRNTLVEYFSESKAVNGMVNAVSESVGSLFKEQTKALEDTHALLQRARYGENGYTQIQIIPPDAWIDQQVEGREAYYGEIRKEYGAPIEKWQETIIDPESLGGKDRVVSTKKKLPNETSIKVLLQHMTDSAILYASLKELLSTAEFADYKAGIMTIHDAVGGSVAFTRQLEAIYQRKAIEINSKYDFVQAALYELKYAHDQVVSNGGDFKLVADMNKQIAILEKDLAISIPAKQAALANAGIDSSFGVNPDLLSKVSELDLTTKSKSRVTTAGYATVVFNKSGKAYDYEVDDITSFIVGKTYPSFGTTFTVKSITKAKDYRKKSNVVYTNLNTKLQTSHEQRWKEDPKNPIPFAINLPEAIKDVVKFRSDVKNILKTAETLNDISLEFGGEQGLESLPKELSEILQEELSTYMDSLQDDESSKSRFFGKDGNKTITDKARGIIEEKLRFSPKEMVYLKNRFGEDALNRMFINIADNMDSIDLLGDTKMSSLAAMFVNDRVQVGTAPIDVRELKMDVAGITSLGLTAQKKVIDQLVNELSEKGTFKSKVIFLEILSHELDHKSSLAYVSEYFEAKKKGKDTTKYKDLEYIENTMKLLRRTLDSRLTENFRIDGSAKDARLHYALYGMEIDGNIDSPIDTIAMLEFMAIMRNEPKYANTLMSKAYPGKSSSFISEKIKQLIAAISNVISKLVRDRKSTTKKQINQLDTLFKTINSIQSKEVLKTALDIAYVKGNDRDNQVAVGLFGDIEVRFIDVMKSDYKDTRTFPKDKTTSVLEASSEVVNTLDKKLSKIINRGIDLSQDALVNSSKAKEIHESLMKSSRIYRDTFNAVKREWDDNSFVGTMKIYLNAKEGFDYQALNKMSAQATMTEEKKAKFETQEINRLHKLTKGLYTPEETEDLYRLFAEVPLFNLSNTGDLYGVITGELTIDEAIDSIDATEAVKERSQALADYYIDKTTSQKYISTTKGLDTAIKEDVAKLSTLYALKKVPNVDKLLTKLMSSEKHKAATQEFLNLSIAIKNLDDEVLEVEDILLDKHDGNLNHYVFDNNVEVKPVTLDNVDRKLDEELGWRLLRKPGKGKIGIMYRDKGDITVQSGVGVNYSYNPNIHISTSEHYANKTNNGTVGTESGASTVKLTDEELTTIGLIRDPAVSLVKAYSHKMMLLETQAIREEITSKFTYNFNAVGKDKIVKDISSGSHLWYIQLEGDTKLVDMPEDIKRKYKIATSRSDLSSFNQQTTLIRKDISNFVEGYGELQIGKVGTKLNKAFSILKKSVLLQKIHWVVVNPTKQAMDATSNAMYLLSRNVSVVGIYKGTKKYAPAFAELNNLQQQQLDAEFRYRASQTLQNKKKVELIENRIKKHALAVGVYSGYMTNATVELSGTNSHTKGGVHKDISNLLDKIFKHDDESLNIAGKLIKGFSKWGFQGEDILAGLANKFEGSKGATSKNIARGLQEMSDHLKDIKNEDDVSSYIQEYMATPNSSLVKIGSYTQTLPDKLAKLILHDFLVAEEIKKLGRTPSDTELKAMHEKVAADVNKSVLNPNLPTPQELRLLEQTGVTSFISFWARINNVIIHSIRNNPANAAFTMIMDYLLGSGVETIYQAAIPNKHQLFGLPTPGLDILLPTKILPFKG